MWLLLQLRQLLQSITLTTTSTSSTWSPAQVSNTGNILKWSVSGGITIPEIVINDPTLNLSGNTGVATITITSDDGFAGLSILNFEPNGVIESEITSIDVSSATALTRLSTSYNQLTNLNVSQNAALTSLTVRGNFQFPSGVLDISNNPLLTYIQGDVTPIVEY